MTGFRHLIRGIELLLEEAPPSPDKHNRHPDESRDRAPASAHSQRGGSPLRAHLPGP
jgi:hypothetical protein